MNSGTAKKLIEAAINGINNSYVPYSQFQVSAALLCKDGSIYLGNNIENASYPATVCAERTAFFEAVKAGKRDFEAIAICGGKHGVITGYCPPCGICRQVMREFCRPDEFLILLPKDSEDYKTYTLDQLLPESFGPEHLS